MLGRSPVAQALTRLGSALGYAVAVHAPGAEPEDFPDAEMVVDSLELAEAPRPQSTFTVVCSQGEYDEDALEAALALPAPYLAFVASTKKWQAVRNYLAERGCTPDQLDQLNT